MIEISTDISLTLLALGVLLTLLRIVRGPTLADRILGLDTLTILSIGIVATFAARSRLGLYDDISISLALMSPLATIALARYVLSRTNVK